MQCVYHFFMISYFCHYGNIGYYFYFIYVVFVFWASDFIDDDSFDWRVLFFG